MFARKGKYLCVSVEGDINIANNRFRKNLYSGDEELSLWIIPEIAAYLVEYTGK